MREELPLGWTRTVVGALGTWSGGGTPSKSEPSFWTGGTIPWVSPKDMKTERISDATDKITEEAVRRSATRIVPAGSVLVVTRSGILEHSLPVAVTDVAVSINQDLKALIPTGGVDADFVALGLKAYEPEILQACSKAGTTVANINLESFLAFPFALPPIAEQRRIVARIEALFARTRQARTDLLRVTALAGRRMSAALAAAFRGDLLSPGPDDTMPPPLVPLRNVVHSLRYGTAQKCSAEPRGVAVLRIPNVANGRIDLGDLKYGELDRAELERLRLQVGDILIIRSNGSPALVGRPALVGPEADGLAFAGYLIRARPRSDCVVPAYLSLMLQSPQIREHIEINARSSSGVHNINSEELGALEVPLPTSEQQRQIVERLNSEQGHAVRLAHNATRALALLDHLERSILTRAFRGELVPQDPGDEPASTLLASLGGNEMRTTRRRGRTAA